MKHTFSVIFYLKRQPASTNKNFPIIARITVNGEKCTINTQLKCQSDLWNVKEYKVEGKTSEAAFTNDTLNQIKARLNQIYFQHSLCDGDVTPEMIKDIYTGVAYSKRHLISYFSIHNENFRKQVNVSRSQASYQKYEAIRKHLVDFLQSTKGIEDIPLYKVNHQFICEFEIYLRTVSGCNHNSTAKFMQLFKRIIILALKNGIIKNDPFQEYQIKLKQTNRTFLTIDEVKSIMKQELPYERLELVRDLFLFAVFTGIAFVDVKNLSKSHLHTAVDGHQWLRFERWKTKEMSNIRLFEVPARLIEKYSDPKRETLFPMLSNQKVNQYLKEIAEVCGVEKRITYHCGRHTMATTIAFSNGMPMESLAKLLGHKNIRTTQLYARITDTKLNADMESLEEKLADFRL